ncbi:50S ribosomal protein L18 [Alkalibacter rhizosphaerae]|uniref:Large ribosomal subunit protein uL18 n=1 Tax=Alkalibacter rhizosphaerae TaxID=2815577 RepID=A0A974XF53_9FIRM|nr:50S ribosomal protein L18 [Alkalibacter rhizosphaerae]QSX07475.1 50S ribosomal protein L18 [Alkalibacter rhizosphaerae]
MIKKPVKNKIRKNRHRRLRFKLSGTTEKPRLNVYRSNANIYAQIIDDSNGTTLVSASTLDKELKETISSTRNKAAAKAVGAEIAKKALAKGIENVVFDRGGYIYHGKVKELAEGAREAGLKF